ncbi:hypothetical protein U0070_021809 [Myodes glareolus]|uniref:Uncharacterized protein n=1 Tax=Myodes glareolus TaxID=447135 RepID=A0AAW0HNN2_MYOGA
MGCFVCMDVCVPRVNRALVCVRKMPCRCPTSILSVFPGPSTPEGTSTDYGKIFRQGLRAFIVPSLERKRAALEEAELCCFWFGSNMTMGKLLNISEPQFPRQHMEPIILRPKDVVHSAPWTYLFVYACALVCPYATVCKWKPEDNLWESVLYFYHNIATPVFAGEGTKAERKQELANSSDVTLPDRPLSPPLTAPPTMKRHVQLLWFQ